jgi:elongation factor Ts
VTSLDQVRALREATGAGVVEAKRALEEAGGDLEAAAKLLRVRGKAKAAGTATRKTTEGIVATYVHPNGKLAATVALACETDFVARTKEFQILSKDLAMQVAAMNPKWLTPDDVPASERSERAAEARESAKGKPAPVADKIVAGRLDKWFAEVCLSEQPFIKDDSQRVKDLVAAAAYRLGENVTVVSFSRTAI